jgi:hypothetical protein
MGSGNLRVADAQSPNGRGPQRLSRTQRAILERVLSGQSDAGVRFADLRALVRALGFSERIRGDHHVFHREGVRDIINVQPQRDGLAKPYQVRQVRGIIVKYGLAGGTDD